MLAMLTYPQSDPSSVDSSPASALAFLDSAHASLAEAEKLAAGSMGSTANFPVHHDDLVSQFINADLLFGGTHS